MTNEYTKKVLEHFENWFDDLFQNEMTSNLIVKSAVKNIAMHAYLEGYTKSIEENVLYDGNVLKEFIKTCSIPEDLKSQILNIIDKSSIN